MKLTFCGFDLQTTLLPCPFCENSDKILLKFDNLDVNDITDTTYYGCEHCGARGPWSQLDPWDNPGDIILFAQFVLRAEWNRHFRWTTKHDEL